jgi:hypothetical protein
MDYIYYNRYKIRYMIYKKIENISINTLKIIYFNTINNGIK